MRRFLPLLLAATSLLLAGLVPTSTAGATGEGETVAYLWPTGTIVSGDSPTMTVTITGHDGPRLVKLLVWDGDTETLLDETTVVVGSDVATLQFPPLTVDPPLRDFTAVVVDPATGALLDQATQRLTVTPRTSVFTALKLPGGTFDAREKALITGVVPGVSGRSVMVQAKAADGWIDLHRATTDGAGRFSLSAPTWWVNRTTVRVVAFGTGEFGGVASDPATMTVRRTYKPRGGTAFARSVYKSRWNPCQVITYRVNPRRVPARGLADVKEAFRRVSEASGLRFRYVGRTTFVPYHRNNRAGQTVRNADFAIAWATQRMVPGLREAIGLGGGQVIWTNNHEYMITKGNVVLDTEPRLAAGFKGGATTGYLLAHEIGHAVGLGHVNDKRQIMYPSMTRLPAEYAGGDLAGMRAVGAQRGCFGTAQARAVGQARGTEPPTVTFVSP